MQPAGHQAKLPYEHKLDGCLSRLLGSEGCLCCLVGLHVDDMLISGNPQSECYLTAKKLLREKFNFKPGPISMSVRS